MKTLRVVIVILAFNLLDSYLINQITTFDTTLKLFKINPFTSHPLMVIIFSTPISRMKAVVCGRSTCTDV